MNGFKILGIVCAGYIATMSLRAQDYQRQQPKVPENKSQEAQLPQGELPKVTGSKEFLIGHLRAVVFVDRAEKVQAENPTKADGVVKNSIPLIQSAEFDEVVKPYLGKPLSMEKLQTLVREIIIWCRKQDRPVVDVIVPQQDISSGILQLVFIEGKVGEVKVQGNKWFSTESIRELVRLNKGDSIGTEKLESDINWINKNPFRSSNVLFTPGKEVGSTDVILETKDRFPVRPYIGYENTGNTLTGEDRYIGGFNWGDAFFVGHQLNYQYMTNGDGEGLTAHSGSYIIPLPWRHTLTFFGSTSSTKAETGGFDIKGAGAQLGMRYDIPLPKVASFYDHSFQVGYDWKQSDNSLEFGAVNVNASTTDVNQIVFGYTGQAKDAYGITSINPQIFWSPADVTDHQSDTNFNSSRTNASSDYAYLNLALTRLTKLPWDFSLVNEFHWQISNGNLLPSEQLQYGGSSSIRGYNEWDITGTDEGWYVRNELRTPAISFGKIFNQPVYNDQLQFLFFYDYGQAWSHRGQITLNNGQARDTVDMASVGPGLRYNIGSYLTLKTDYGFQLEDTGDIKGSRWSISAILSY